MIGICTIACGVTDAIGMVTAREPAATLDLPAVNGFAFGGHDIWSQRIEEAAEETAGCDDAVVPDILNTAREDLHEIDEHVELGTTRRCGKAVEGMSSEMTGENVSVAGIVEEIRTGYAALADPRDVDRLVAVNAASTEPPIPMPGNYDTLAAFETMVGRDDSNLPVSALYAYAALLDGHPYVNFAPSIGSSFGGPRELAERNGVPHMGRDGKIDETLVKSVLEPMLAGRNPCVLSQKGHNILGNSNGLVLEDDVNKVGKIEDKGSLLGDILGYETHNAVRTDYTSSLGDWKTTWDHVHFEGFLGTEMKMQLTWEGVSSALATPPAPDLVRLATFANEHGEGGTMSHLASFFKLSEGVDRHEPSERSHLLYGYTERHTEEV